MASFPRASNQAEWQRPPQRTPHSPIAYLPSGALHLPLPTGRPTAHSGEFESGLPRSAQPPPPPPRRVLSHAQAATSLTGQAYTSLSRGVSLHSAGHQAAGYYGAVPQSSQQQQQQWLLPVQGQNLPFGGHQAWVQTAYRQPPYSQQPPMAVPQQLAEHQPALQQPVVAPQVRTHSAPSPQYAHARPQPWQQPSVQHVSQQTASQRLFSSQKSSLNGNARPFVGSAKASASRSVAADVYSEASGSEVSSRRTSHNTSSPLQNAATGRVDQRRVDRQLNASARAYIPQNSLKSDAQEDRQPNAELHLHVAAQDSAAVVKSGVQAETELERVLHLLLPEQTALRGQPTSSSVGQDPLCQKLLEQAPEKLQEQLQQQAQSSGGSGPSSGGESVSPRLVSSGDAEHVPPVAMQKVKLVGQHPLCQKLLDQAPKQPQEQLPKLAESSGVTGPISGGESVSPRLVSSGDGEGVSPVAMQKVPVAVDDATPSPTIKAGVLNEDLVKESAGSFTLSAHRGTIHHGQQASGRLDSDASHPQTDTAVPHTADGAGSAVPSEPAVATAVDLADSDCTTEAALDKGSAHSSGSPGSAAIDLDGLLPVPGDTDSPTAASSSSARTAQHHASTAEAGSATQAASDASAGAAHASTGAAATKAASSGQAATAVAELTDSGRRTSAAETTSSAVSMFAARAGIRSLSPSGSFLPPMGDDQSELSSPPGSFRDIGGARSGLNSPPSSFMRNSDVLSEPSSSSTAFTAADSQLDDSRSMLGQAEDKPGSAAAAATAAKSVIGHISSSGMPSQATTSADDDVSSFTAAAGKGTGAVKASEEGSKSMVSDIPQGGGVVDSPAHSPNSPPLHALVEGEQNAQLTLSSLSQKSELDTPAAQSANIPPLECFSGREESFKLTPTRFPRSDVAQPPAVGSKATAAAEQVSAFAWQAAQLQSGTHATNADTAAPVNGTHREGTMLRSGSSEQDVQLVVSSQQQAACSEQQQDSSNITHEGGVHFIANAEQSAEKQDTSSRAAFEEEAQPATATAAPVQPHQSVQQSAGEEEEQVLDGASAREQQPSSSTSKDEDDGDAARCQISEEEQQQLPGRSIGHEAHHHASTDVEDSRVAFNTSRQEEERIALLTHTKVEGQWSSSPDPVREEEEQGPSQLATKEDKQGTASSISVMEGKEQGLRQSAAQEDRQQTSPSSLLREEDEQAISQSTSEAAEEEQWPTDPSHDAEQSADTSGPLLLSPSSPAFEEEAVHRLQTSSANDARLQPDDTSCRADSSLQRKAKPGFLAKALFCSVAWPVLVPIVAFSSCIQLYDACSMSEVLRYTV